VVEGALPDGQAYIVSGLRDPEQIESVSAGIAVGIPPFELIGSTTFSQPTEVPAVAAWDGDRLLLPAGEWVVTIDVDPGALIILGPDAREVIESGIAAYPVDEMAALELDYPFYFTDDRDDPVRIEVRYATFMVRRGCNPVAGVVCSDDGYLQVVPLNPDDDPLPGSVVVESTYTGDQVRFLVLGVNTNARDQQWRIDHAADAEQIQQFWQSYGFAGVPPDIDLHRYVVLFYHRPDDACPDYLMRMTFDGEYLVAKFGLPFGGSCNQPLIPTSYAVSVDRATVPEQFVAIMRDVPELPGFELGPTDHPVDISAVP
jgi:hypothetical protein